MSRGLSTSKYLPALDGLRGVAIIAVMLFHANIPFFKGDKFLQGGFIGVDIFFVLSGYLITSLLISEFDRTGSINLKSFFIRRMLRLGPGFFVLLAIFCTISFFVLNQEDAKKNYIDALISAAYLSNWARAFRVHPPDFLGHTWSLSIEAQFYLLWPVIIYSLLKLISNRRIILFIVAITALAAWAYRICLAYNGATIGRLFNGLDTRADALIVGCTIGIMMASKLVVFATPIISKKQLSLLSVCSTAGLCVFAVISNWYVIWMHYWGFFLVELLTGIVIIDVVTNQKSVLKNYLMMRGLVWVGSISYGLYLWHYPIFRAVTSLGFQGSPKFLIGIFITFSCAILSYYIIELPILNYKIRLPH